MMRLTTVFNEAAAGLIPSVQRPMSSQHTSLEVLVGQKKELWIPPIWGCWGPTGDSFFTHEQIKHPPFFEGRWYTGKIICQIWAEWAVCLDSYLWKGWMFYLSIGKKLTSSRSTTTPDRWYQKFFFFGQLALLIVCVVLTSFFGGDFLSTMAHCSWDTYY